MKPVFLCTVLLIAVVPGAIAAEQTIALKNAQGREVVEAMCAGCHSLDYIPLNSPFFNRDGWTAEVNKMVNAYGAPIPATEAGKIVEYLAANYGQ
jgi:mono/diheme cytochrome c family protein